MSIDPATFLFPSNQVLDCTTKHFSTDPSKGEGENSGGGDLQVEDKVRNKPRCKDIKDKTLSNLSDAQMLAD